MQLSMFSDYALRVLVHLANSPETLLSTRQIADIHNAKFNHLSKVTTWHVTQGYVESLRGRGGGLRLAKDPSEINLGHLLRQLEADKPLVECFNAQTNTCQLIPACGLMFALKDAQEAFFAALDHVTIANMMTRSPNMSNLLNALNTGQNPQN